ncbi:SAP domain-containing protein [Staphylococcus nepalensis]|uniref:SAP domain-containing protein n=1 Tax=Staphylococcus nepalensis TaxID=214473 RepID=UPI0031BA4F67
MNFTANELILLNKNENREVNKEIFENNTLANNDKRVLSSIKNLIDNGALIKSQDFDTSINKLTVSQLKEILSQNNIKKNGNKLELIDKIKKIIIQ